MNKLFAISFIVLFWVIATQVQAGVAPSNDLCTDPSGPLSIPSTTAGTSINAIIDEPPAFECNGESITAGGVWYTLIGNGNTISVSTCDTEGFNGSADYDTRISVYCDDCEDLTCITGNDDAFPFCTGFINASTVSFCSQAGALYRILVSGFSDNTGNFELDILDDDTPCDPTIMCALAPLPPSGPIVIIPTMGQWGMIIATILLGFFAVFALRSRTES